MKRTVLLLTLLAVLIKGYNQVPSNCVVAPQLASEYEQDIKNMVLRRMYQVHSPDTMNVTFSQAWQDTVVEGLAAIFNATSIPERDTVFNIYCVHDNTSLPEICNDLLIRVDTSYAWTDAWQSMTTLTGNAYIDAIVTQYDLEITAFYNWGIGNYAVLHTDLHLNTDALIDSFEVDPGIISGEQDGIIGDAGKIDYSVVGTDRYYEFWFEFNDCFDGCDNYRKWIFRVQNDCSVSYLGYQEWGYFGIEPLPAPINCNTFTGIEEPATSILYTVFPNPTDEQINISFKGATIFEGARLMIYNITGEQLFNINLSEQNQSIDVSNLAAGIYSMVIQNGRNYIETHPFIKK